MQFIIDGYNVLKTFPRYINIRFKNDANRTFFNLIKKYPLIGCGKHETYIVFDGYDNYENPSKSSSFKIIFSEDETADDVIKSIVEYSKKPQEIYVVSDDREIRDFIRIMGAHAISVKEFADAIMKKVTQNVEEKISNEKTDGVNANKINKELFDLWTK